MELSKKCLELLDDESHKVRSMKTWLRSMVMRNLLVEIESLDLPKPRVPMLYMNGVLYLTRYLPGCPPGTNLTFTHANEVLVNHDPLFRDGPSMDREIRYEWIGPQFEGDYYPKLVLTLEATN
jgi:hypothetical protein